MHNLWLCVLAACAGCSGISIGESSKDEAVPECTERTEAPVTDTSKVPRDFKQSPAALLGPLTGAWQGTLDLAHGQDAPVTIQIAVDDGSIRAIYAGDSAACEPWLAATVTLDIDAGPTLRGKAQGELTTRGEAQIRADWIDLNDFDSTLEVPDFGAEIIHGPSLLLDFLYEPRGRWHGDWQFAAQVATKPCDAKTEMCTGTPNDFTPEYRELGTLELQRSEDP